MTEQKKSSTRSQQDIGEVKSSQTDIVGIKNESQHTGSQPITCGLIMPIASNDGGSAEHWRQVREVITSALTSLNLKVQMVSESEAVNVIHKNIVQNIFSNEIVVCDVSSRNPNVMFELGMRLAFDKPVVIIKDRDTPFSFDIGSIQHIEYPHSLNYIEILSFQKELLEKVRFTMREANAAKISGDKYSPFLSNYAITEVTGIKTEAVNKEEYMISAIKELKDTIGGLVRQKESHSTAPYKFNNMHHSSYKDNILSDSMMRPIVDELLTMLEKCEPQLNSIHDVEDYCNGYLDACYPNLVSYLKTKVIDSTVEAFVNS
ncbi:hypothetical protein [Aeromonas hydrophila]